MSACERTGHDGPYAAPFWSDWRAVPKDWLDYNGHMNVAYYTMAFDQTIDVFLEQELGIGESHVKFANAGPYAMQANYRYLDEILLGEKYRVSIQLIDHDSKRLHLYLEMFKAPETCAASCEELLINVDLNTRRSAPYPDWAVARLEKVQASHSRLTRPECLGQGIGIRRKAIP